MRLPVSFKRFAAALFLAALAAPLWFEQGVRAATLDDDDYYDAPATRVGRVSRLDGEASLRQSGGDWEDVGANSPVFEGDEFYTGDNSRMEIQLGGGRYLRLDARTDVVFAYLDEHSVRVEVPAGTVIVSVREVDGDESFQVSAPAAAVTIREGGVYRVDVDDDGNTRVGVARGRARVSGTARTVEIEEGEAAHLDYNYPDNVDVVAYHGLYDGFDSWSADLDQRYDDAYARSDQYVDSLGSRNDIYGLAELINYGSWFDSGLYGMCWRPSVGYGWQPYYNGYWQWYPGYGYTWVSYDPWGWAPYHYGRWAYLNGYGWAWVPWSQYAGGSYYWSPAQVYWYQYPGYNGYSYVPLAPNEPYIDYRRFDKRHQRDFIPEHLRAGRGIGLTQPGSAARLKPVANTRPVKGTDFGGRVPVAVNPRQPANVEPIKPRFKPNIPAPVRTRPVVVDPTASGAKPRRPAAEGRPTREAAGDRGTVTVAKPGRTPAVDETPTMVESRPLPGRLPADRKPVVKDSRDTGRPGGETVVTPRRPKTDTPERPSSDRPKPRRIEPTGPPKQVGGGSVDRQPKVDRTPKADRAPVNREPARVEREPKVVREPRAEPAPRSEPRRSEAPRSEPRRSEPPPRVVERSAPPPPPPPARVERAPDSGNRQKPNR